MALFMSLADCSYHTLTLSCIDDENMTVYAENSNKTRTQDISIDKHFDVTHLNRLFINYIIPEKITEQYNTSSFPWWASDDTVAKISSQMTDHSRDDNFIQEPQVVVS